MRISYSALTAFAPGMIDNDDWHNWAVEERRFATTDVLPPCPVPVMMRRRMTPVGRLALTALSAVGLWPGEAAVFASSWGEVGRTAKLLNEMFDEATGMSPAGFASGVHNAIAGTAAIWLKNNTIAPAISAGNFTTEAALIECASILAEGSESVVLVRYDEPLPQQWASRPHQVETPAKMYAWALRMVREEDLAQGSFELSILPHSQRSIPNQSTGCEKDFPTEMRFLFGGSDHFEHRDSDGRGWLWAR